MEFTTRLERNNFDKHLSQSYTNSDDDNTDDLSPTYSMYTHTDDAGIVSFEGHLLAEGNDDSYSVVCVNSTGTNSSTFTSTNTSMAQIMGMEHISAWLELAFADDSDMDIGDRDLSEANSEPNEAAALILFDPSTSDTQLVESDSDVFSLEDTGDVDLDGYDGDGHNSDLSSAHMPISSLNVTYLCPTCHRKFTSYQACTHHRHARRHGSPTQPCTLDWEHFQLPHSCASAHHLSPVDSHSGWCDLKGPKRYGCI